MLDEIRQKSPQVKKAYAFWGALTITALVAVVWSVSLPVRLRTISTFSLEPESTSQAAGSAFSRFFDDLWGGSEDEAGEEAAPGPAAASTTPAADASAAGNQPAATGTPANPPAVLIAPTSSRPVATTTKPAIQIATSSAAEE